MAVEESGADAVGSKAIVPEALTEAVNKEEVTGKRTSRIMELGDSTSKVSSS